MNTSFTGLLATLCGTYTIRVGGLDKRSNPASAMIHLIDGTTLEISCPARTLRTIARYSGLTLGQYEADSISIAPLEN